MMRKTSKKIKYILILFFIITCGITLYCKDKEIDDIFPFLDKGVGKWVKTEKLIYPKVTDTDGVLMDNGNVFLGGGSGKDIYKSSKFSQIYITKKNKFIKGPSLIDKRYGHHTFKLKNGDIIIIGGVGVGKIAKKTQVEKIDFKNNKSVIIGHLQHPEDYEYLIQLHNDSIFCFGMKPYIWEPNSNKSKDLPLFNYYRLNPSVLELKDKSILLTGGILSPGEPFSNYGLLNKTYKNNDLTTINSIERYDNKNNKFILEGKMVFPRCKHTSILLNNGNVLIVGGRGNQYKDKFLDKKVFKKNIRKEFKKNFSKYSYWQDYIQEVELYNPNTKESKVVAKLNFAIGDNLQLDLIQDRYILVSNGYSYRNEIIDTKTWNVYYTKKNKKITCSKTIKLNDDTFLYIGSYMANAVSFGMLYKFEGIENIKE